MKYILKNLKISAFFVILTVSSSLILKANISISNLSQQKNLIGHTIDDLVLKGIKYIKAKGKPFKARAGSGLQAYGVSYTLLNPRNRLHSIRKPVSIRYLCREFLAYFKGSLDVDQGLSQASRFWKTLIDKNNKVNSNYGYYVFHQKVPEYGNKTQYQWCIANLLKNPDSRKAFININQVWHKTSETKDFPCTIGMQFFVKENKLCCSVFSRSTDIYTGLPYDMGFFSFVTELLYQDLKEQLPKEKGDKLALGYVTMKTNFTQIYDKTRDQALQLLKKKQTKHNHKMPAIENAKKTLNDIYKMTRNTPIIKWIWKNAKM